MKSLTRKDIYVILFCFFSYLLLAKQSLFLSNDDFAYRFHQSTGNVISSFAELIQSNLSGYTNVNGRFLVHVFAQCILAWDLFGFFHIASACAYVLLLCSILYLVRRTKNNSGDLVFVLFFFLLFYPLMASTCYGTVCLTVNYLWSAAIYTFFLSMYFHIKDDDTHYSVGQNILLLIFGLVCGSWQESFGIGIGGAICLYHIAHLRTTKKSVFFLIIGFGIGLMILLFAPGNFARVRSENEGFIGLSNLMYQIVQLCKHNLFVDIWIIIGIISIVIDYFKKNNFAFVKSNWMFFLVGTLTLLLTIYTLAFGMMQGVWQLTFLAIVDVVLTMRFFQTYFSTIIESEIIYVIVVVSMSVFMGVVYGYRSVLRSEKQSFVNDFCSRKSDTIYDGQLQYTIMNEIPSSSEFMYEKICDMYCSFYNNSTLPLMSRYYTYGQEVFGTTLLPEPKELIIAHCTERNRIDENVYLTPLQYYVVRVPKEKAYDNCTLVFTLEKKSKLFRVLDNLRNKEYIEHFSLCELKTVEDHDYLYAVKTLGWWHYHKMNVVNAVLKKEDNSCHNDCIN